MGTVAQAIITPAIRSVKAFLPAKIGKIVLENGGVSVIMREEETHMADSTKSPEGAIMDQRKDQLKYLKKEYKRKKRHTITPLKVMTVLGFVCAAVLAAAGAYPVYEATLVQLCPAAGAFTVTQQALLVVRAAALVSLIVGVSAAIMWGNGKRKLKRSEAFLNWRTMKEVLHTEKAMK